MSWPTALASKRPGVRFRPAQEALESRPRRRALTPEATRWLGQRPDRSAAWPRMRVATTAARRPRLESRVCWGSSRPQALARPRRVQLRRRPSGRSHPRRYRCSEVGCTDPGDLAQDRLGRADANPCSAERPPAKSNPERRVIDRAPIANELDFVRQDRRLLGRGSDRRPAGARRPTAVALGDAGSRAVADRCAVPGRLNQRPIRLRRSPRAGPETSRVLPASGWWRRAGLVLDDRAARPMWGPGASARLTSHTTRRVLEARLAVSKRHAALPALESRSGNRKAAQRAVASRPVGSRVDPHGSPRCRDPIPHPAAQSEAVARFTRRAMGHRNQRTGRCRNRLPGHWFGCEPRTPVSATTRCCVAPTSHAPRPRGPRPERPSSSTVRGSQTVRRTPPRRVVSGRGSPDGADLPPSAIGPAIQPHPTAAPPAVEVVTLRGLGQLEQGGRDSLCRPLTAQRAATASAPTRVIPRRGRLPTAPIPVRASSERTRVAVLAQQAASRLVPAGVG